MIKQLQDLLYPYAPNKLSKIEMDTKIIPAIEELVISMLPKPVKGVPSYFVKRKLKVGSVDAEMVKASGYNQAIKLMEARIKEA